MQTPPISASYAASFAGTSRAAEAQSASAAAGDQSPTAPTGRSVDGVEKDTASQDSAADGRQLLDTFEKHSQDNHESDRGRQKPPVVVKSNRSADGHLDFDA